MLTDPPLIAVPVPRALAEQMDVAAARLQRSRAWVLEQALAAWVDQEEARHRMTLLALDDVDAGRVLDHQAIQAWANDLVASHGAKPSA